MRRRDYVLNINRKVNVKLDLMDKYVNGIRLIEFVQINHKSLVIKLLVRIGLENPVNLSRLHVQLVRSIIVALTKMHLATRL